MKNYFFLLIIFQHTIVHSLQSPQSRNTNSQTNVNNNSSFLGAWSKYLWNTGRSWYNWAEHSTSTTKVNNSLGFLRDSFCTTAKATSMNCTKILNDYYNAYPLTYDETLKNRVQQDRKKEVCIRISSDICQQEDDFRVQRMAHISRSLTTLFPQLVKNKDSYIPTIGLCASGGGFRAMIATLGMLEALQPQDNNTPGIIDIIMNMSCLSGSTWAILPHAVGLPLDALKASYKKYALIPVNASPRIINELKKNPLVFPSSCVSPSTFNYQNTTYPCNYFNNNKAFQDNIMRAFMAGRPLSFVSVYGAMIAHMVLAPFDDPEIHDRYCKHIPVQSRQQILLSQAQAMIEQNSCSYLPFPIATMVSPLSGREATLQKTQKSPYLWAEVTPYEAGFDFYTPNKKLSGAYVPTTGMERFFTRKNTPSTSSTSWFSSQPQSYSYCSKDEYPEPPLSYLLGIFGSAFAFGFTDIMRMNFGIDDHAQGIKGIFSTIISTLSRATFLMPTTYLLPHQNTRLFPAELPNYGIMPESPFYGRNHTTWIDAGIAYNLPVLALLKRKNDVIIMLDASADVPSGTSTELIKAENHMRQLGIPFPKIAGTQAFKNSYKEPYTIFDEYLDGQTGPFILYIPVSGSDGTFDVEQCLKNDCNTFNFKYDPKTIDALFEFTKNRTQQALQALTPLLKKKIEEHTQKQTQPKEQHTLAQSLKKPLKRLLSYTKNRLRGMIRYFA